MFLGLAEMMFGLVNVSFSLPEWQAVKVIFFAPCLPKEQRNTLEVLINLFDGLVLFVKVTGSEKGLKLRESFHLMWRTKKHCSEGLSVHKGMKLCQETVFTYSVHGILKKNSTCTTQPHLPHFTSSLK